MFEDEPGKPPRDQKIEYLQIVMADREEESIIDHFPDFYCFLEDAFNSNFRSEKPDKIKGMNIHAINFDQKTCDIQWKTPIHEKFNHIANTTVSCLTKNKVLVHC